MSDPLAESLERLKRLVDQVMTETDPAKYDALASEIWQVLYARQVLQGHPTKEVRSTASEVMPPTPPAR